VSRNQRLGLVALAVVVAAVAFVIARPSSDDDKGSTDTAETRAAPGSDKGGGASAPKPQQIKLKDHAPVGGVSRIRAPKGARVSFTVTGDKADKIHLHGYDIEKELKPGKPATFSFAAKTEGAFEIESHEAEHLGKPALVGRLLIGPSS
jgi:hypothetical protein